MWEPIIRWPLRLTPPLGGGAIGLKIPEAGDAQFVILVFEPRGSGYECMACAEVYGSWGDRLLSPGDVEAHAKAHQLGYDYALCVQKKMEAVNGIR